MNWSELLRGTMYWGDEIICRRCELHQHKDLSFPDVPSFLEHTKEHKEGHLFQYYEEMV